jgi:hypothetical protein
MKVILAAGTGSGVNEQAAYEAALSHAEMSDHDVPGNTPIRFSARALMLQSQPGRWAHVALGWLHDARIVESRFIALQDENLERLQRRLRAAARDAHRDEEPPQLPLRSRFASIVCRGEPVCALILATHRESLVPLTRMTQGAET